MTTNTRTTVEDSKLTIGPTGELEEIVFGIYWTFEEIERLLDTNKIKVNRSQLTQWVADNADKMELMLAEVGNEQILRLRYIFSDDKKKIAWQDYPAPGAPETVHAVTVLDELIMQHGLETDDADTPEGDTLGEPGHPAF